MGEFGKIYGILNAEQKEAVDTIDGPLLVIAGPGTGKTQLLSARVAKILQSTDTLPNNILCLTFTENGALNMRERLTRFIGQDAHAVTISTYHAFGSDLVRKFPQYFTETRLQEPVDELGKHQIISSLIDQLPYNNPLKQTRHHIGDVVTTLSEVKRALLTGDDIRNSAEENLATINALNGELRELSLPATMPRKFDAAISIFQKIYNVLSDSIPSKPVLYRFGSLAEVAYNELNDSLQAAQELGKTTPLTNWKNKWLAKDADNQYVFDGKLQNQRLRSLADVYDAYEAALAERGLYDFDDMIIRSLQALEKYPEFKFTLQEQYLYILLDEFQDTNAAQLRMVELLSDNPVHEGRPNVMAVGDDDQAIYAFQGAQYSNMLDFYHMYRDVKVCNLVQNYRSHTDILLTAQSIAEQISERLHERFDGTSKTLVAANTKLKQSYIERVELASDIAQYDWIAESIAKQIKSGTPANEIAVLAPKHRYIEPLVAYLNARDIPVRYEKRENILEAPVIKQLLTMAELVIALRDDNVAVANSLWPEVLSYEFWKIPISQIWKVSWAMQKQESPLSWAELLLENTYTQSAALLMLSLAPMIDTFSCETMMDYLIGTESLATTEDREAVLVSPLKAYYTNPKTQATQPDIFYLTLSHLKVLRTRLRKHQAAQTETLSLRDLLNLVRAYNDAGMQMLNTSPYSQSAEAVQLMTVFKAKGLEYEHVYLPCCHDDVWGSTSRGNSNKLTLPANLAPIRHAGATDDERLRILYVALTRAKTGLHLTSFTAGYDGKPTSRLSYFDEQELEDGWRCGILPPSLQSIITDTSNKPAQEQFEYDWRVRHSASSTSLKNLLRERLASYRLSPTHINAFIDTIYAGPEAFYFNTILRFPKAPSLDGQYGNAIHETLEWCQHKLNDTGSFPDIERVLAYFTSRIVHKRFMPEQEKLELDRGHQALRIYLSQRRDNFKQGSIVEHNFAGEGVVLGDVLLGGKIDRLDIDKKNKIITVVDYKTGKSYEKWKKDVKLHKYKQQLYCYKILIERSKTFRGYTVNSGRLEFVEPDIHGKVHAIDLLFDESELKRTEQLIKAIWKRIQALDFPDISSYPATLKGIEDFEKYLINSA